MATTGNERDDIGGRFKQGADPFYTGSGRPERATTEEQRASTGGRDLPNNPTRFIRARELPVAICHP